MLVNNPQIRPKARPLVGTAKAVLNNTKPERAQAPSSMNDVLAAVATERKATRVQPAQAARNPNALRTNVGAVKPGDYVVAQITSESDKTSHIVIRVEHVSATQVNGVTVKDAHWNGKDVQVSPGDVVANFGEAAPALKVAGIDLMDGFDAHKAPAGGHIGLAHWDFKPTPETESLLARAYDDTYNLLRAHNLHRLFELHGVMEVTKRQGKYLGRVVASKDLRKNPYRMRINPVHKSLSNDFAVYRYVVAHEFGHVLDLQVLQYDPRIRAKWIDAFRRCNYGTHLDQDFLDGLKQMVLESTNMNELKGSIKKVLEEDSMDLANFKEGMKVFNKALRDTRGLTFAQLYSLKNSDNMEAFEDCFPTREFCVSSNVNVGSVEGTVCPPTKYAMKNVFELFAESFAVLMCSNDAGGAVNLHPYLASLMEWSLARGRRLLPDLLHQLAFNESDPIVLVSEDVTEYN
jgi:hypothetical protein